jgi:hypothetical protein
MSADAIVAQNGKAISENALFEWVAPDNGCFSHIRPAFILVSLVLYYLHDAVSVWVIKN